MRAFVIAIAALLIAACVDATSVGGRTFKFAHKDVAMGKGRVKRDGANATALGVFAQYDYLVLAVQKCYDDGPWTIHGLWPSDYNSKDKPAYCQGPAYSHSAIASIWGQLQQYWATCSWSGSTEDNFLSHEWTKHGTCLGTDELTFFKDGLAIFQEGGWKSQCENASGNSCQVTVTLPSA